jgi:tRNA pseudouridine38-40 synthase
VEGIIQSSLAELFGKVDPRQVVVEGSSRTDKGVHATHMVALIYCLKEEFMPSNPDLVKDDEDDYDYEDVIDEQDKDETHGPAPLTDPSLLLQGYNKGIPGKRLPHPATPTDDTFFLRMCLNVPEFAIRLNHLLPADIRVTGYATPPATPHRYFHPSLNAIAKTYHYTFSVGMIHDPTEWRFVWQILEEDVFRLKQVEEACQLLQGTHDFAAFRGAPRGADDKRRQERESTVCTLYQVAIETVAPEMGIFPPRSDQPLQTFRVIISGNRFLYKMVRFLVGALVAIGTNAMKLSDLQAALTTSARPDNGGWQCAPPHGLVLQHVEFDPPVHWESL